MISIDDIKPGKLLAGGITFVRRRREIFQIISPLQDLKTTFKVNVLRGNYYTNNSKYRYFFEQENYFTKKELLKNNNYIPWLKKPRINEIFAWYILKFENEMYTQEQNP